MKSGGKTARSSGLRLMKLGRPARTKQSSQATGFVLTGWGLLSVSGRLEMEQH